MYLVATHIPMFTDGPRLFLEQDWLRDVLLARDWLAAPFGELVLVAPFRPVAQGQARLERLDDQPGIAAVPALDLRCRAREFWRTGRRQWMSAVRERLPSASVVHTGMDDLYRPMAQLAFRAAWRAGVPTVFYGPDGDPHELVGTKADAEIRRAQNRLYVACYDWALASHLRRADVAPLKEGAVYDRYAPRAARPRAFCHTMFSRADVVSEAALEERLHSLREPRPLRIVYCGRLIRRKGLHVSLELVKRAADAGSRVTFDLIGSGPEEESLREQATRLGLAQSVRFVGQVRYGAELLRRLAGYDALLFTPELEETPRMIYDGYAAGLPLLATDIHFVRHRAAADRAAVTFPIDDAVRGAEALIALDRDRAGLAALARRARAAGEHHAVENWYRRRAEWTMEAVQRRRLAPASPRA
jgi:glycosyltransferase involved in cell wall biosynthesis